MIELQKLSDFIRERCGQLLRLAAGRERLGHAQHGFVAVAVAFTRGDQVCTHEFDKRLGPGRGHRSP